MTISLEDYDLKVSENYKSFPQVESKIDLNLKPKEPAKPFKFLSE